jgi:ketosteroid isomerase-like protein
MKRITYVLSLLTFVALIFSSCTTESVEKEMPEEATIDMANLKIEIQAMEDAYAAAEQAKDADAIAKAYYSENAISYSRNNEPAVGREAIGASIAEGIAKDTLGGHNVYKVVDLFADGNFVVEIGSWTEIDASGAEGETGFYMSYFEKEDGKYKCVRDMNVTTKTMKDAM